MRQHTNTAENGIARGLKTPFFDLKFSLKLQLHHIPGPVPFWASECSIIVLTSPSQFGHVTYFRALNFQKSYSFFVILKQQNRYLSIIIVCGYFSFIRSFSWLNFPSKSNLYHKTSLSMSFWLLAFVRNTTLSVAFYSLYNGIAEEIRTAMSIKHQFMHL